MRRANANIPGGAGTDGGGRRAIIRAQTTAARAQEAAVDAVAPAVAGRHFERHALLVGMGWFGEEPGGLNRMYSGLLEALPGAGIRVTGLVAGTARATAALGTGLHCFAPRGAPWPVRLVKCRWAARAVLRADVDVVAAHFAPYALPWLDLLGRRPFVFHFHGPWSRESRVERERGISVRLKHAVEWAVYRRAARFIVLSGAFRDILVRGYGVSAERVHVVPGGVDAGRFAVEIAPAAARASFGLPGDRPVIGAVRRLVHRMGLDALVDAMQAVRARVPDALLVIAGRGPLAPSLAAQVAERGLDDHVRFAGFVPDAELPAFYRACNFTIVPSVALEGFGLTTIESLATGTPVLVTPIGGLPETVEGLADDLVLDGADAPALARGLADALTGRRALPPAAACRAHVRARFDWPVVAAGVAAVYR